MNSDESLHVWRRFHVHNAGILTQFLSQTRWKFLKQQIKKTFPFKIVPRSRRETNCNKLSHSMGSCANQRRNENKYVHQCLFWVWVIMMRQQNKYYGLLRPLVMNSFRTGNVSCLSILLVCYKVSCNWISCAGSRTALRNEQKKVKIFAVWITLERISINILGELTTTPEHKKHPLMITDYFL